MPLVTQKYYISYNSYYTSLCMYSDDVYSAMVLAATCNCIPGTIENDPSSSLNCQHFQLDPLSGAVNATDISRGQCDHKTYDAITTPFCFSLSTSLLPPGKKSAL